MLGTDRVRYGRRVAAFLRGDEVFFTPQIAALEPDHPVRRFVSMKCLMGVEMQRAPGAEPYDDTLADFYARYGLMPEDEFASLASTMTDAELAEHFDVPLEQVAARRFDLAFLRRLRRELPPG